ncbi:nitroreductase [Aequitasia blattaphilus]|uniref:Nitroreductase family protein n=1 Tax=Aequitasia blattaphilus TaxID=2949332 RepID=A0ABT1E8Y3_9FIRM|nr:nitroreductase family protein [Aequitasia blattaphilus]MCP1102290.1 nitroreductase family protein [Aequitasia blattaphilus]MCR8614930.1 nitroreductase family protein [Aequitasia blattaphilus]
MLDAIKNRRSVRKYTNTPVEKEKLLEVINAARMAPSGHNMQPWTFIVIENEETKKALAFADHEQYWMEEAPVLIACVADIRKWIGGEKVYVNETSDFFALKRVIRDTSIAITHILLEAENQGLSTCWTGWYQQLDVRPLLDIPEDQYVVGIVALGYGAEQPEERPRKKLEEIIRYETWGEEQ